MGNNVTTETPLRLLALDGGGIRGLSSLYILENLMKRIQVLENQGPSRPVKPCDYFDLIAGTSTGGLIAIMLGVLEMDIQSCITEYKNLAPIIFPEAKLSRRYSRLVAAVTGRQLFKPQPFEQAIRELIGRCLENRSMQGKDTMMRFEAFEDQKCKVFVCASTEKRPTQYRFRNYNVSKKTSPDCPIWQACRATSAAPIFFPPMEIDGIAYVDGALGCNNPIFDLMEEAQEIWPNRNIGCILSIGTGVPELKDIGRAAPGLIAFLKTLATDTERTAARFEKSNEGLAYLEHNVYFRFNVEQGLQKVGLEEWKEMETIQKVTINYIDKNGTKFGQCASQIWKPIGFTNYSIKSSVVARSNVPFRRDPNFVRRDRIISQLQANLYRTENHERAAIYGLGGIGKSQIAIEFSYIVRQKHFKTWVFWVYAGTMSRLLEAYRDIAELVGIPDHDDPEFPVMKSVLSWLNDSLNGPWLMILDNADDAGVFFNHPLNMGVGTEGSRSRRRLVDYIPQVSHGKILVTTRDLKIAQQLVGDFSQPIKVDTFDVNDSLALFKTKIPDLDQAQHDDVLELVKELSFIPLAITQAGAYLRESPIMNIRGYLSLLRNDRQTPGAILNQSSFDLRRDFEVENAVFRTWAISFQQIRDQHPRAAELLCLMACLRHEAIPDFLVKGENENKNGIHSALGEEDPYTDIEFMDCMSLLVSFSLIRPDISNKMFDMHRLVKLATRQWMESGASLSRWERCAISRVFWNFTNLDGNLENLRKESLLLPHATAVIPYRATDHRSVTRRCDILIKIGKYQASDFHMELAIRTLEEARSISVEEIRQSKDFALGYRDIYIDTSLELAHIYRSLGWFDQAESLLNDLLSNTLVTEDLELWNIPLSPEQYAKLRCYNALALLFRASGQLDRAEEIARHQMETHERLFGRRHGRTVASMGTLVQIFQSKQEWEESEILLLSMIEVQKEHKDEYPGELAWSKWHLGLCFWNLNRLDEAAVELQSALDFMKIACGDEHESTKAISQDLEGVLAQLAKEDEDVNLEGLETLAIEDVQQERDKTRRTW